MQYTQLRLLNKKIVKFLASMVGDDLTDGRKCIILLVPMIFR